MVATVTGNLVAVTGSARAGVELQFEPRSLPLAEEGSLVVSPSTSVTTAANGEFTAALVAGDYRLVVGDNEATLSLTVPSGGGSFDILELVDAVPFVGESPTATPLATSTRSGKVKTDRDEADPVVATKAYVDEEIAGIDLSSRVAKTGDTMSGALTAPVFKASSGSAASPAFAFTGDDDGSGTGLYWPSANKVGVVSNGVERVRIENNGVTNLLVTGGVGIGATIGSEDVFLVREAAGRLALRNGANEQRFYLYNSYTDAANWERGSLEWNSNSLFLLSAKSGSGLNRDIRIQASGAVFLGGGSDALKWYIATDGHLKAYADNTYDIGTNGDKRPKDIYAAGKLTLGQGCTVGAGYSFQSSTRGQLYFSGVGKLAMLNASLDDFIMLQFGRWDSASFPALKRSGTGLLVRLADDSGDGFLSAGALGVGDGAAATPSIYRASDATSGLHFIGDNLRWGQDGVALGELGKGSVSNSGKLSLFSTGELQLGSSSSTGPTLIRDGDHQLAQRNGANAQRLSLYNTFTDASNYERLGIYWSGNKLFLGTEKAGSGASRAMRISPLSNLELGTGGMDYWYIPSTGHLLATTDNTNDIGASGASRPRNIYASGKIKGQLQTDANAQSGTLSLTHYLVVYDASGAAWGVPCGIIP